MLFYGERVSTATEQWGIELMKALGRSPAARLGKSAVVDPHENVLEIEPAETAQVAARICSDFSARDISITEAPLERIVESIDAQR